MKISIRDEGGQAVLEYILTLVIAIAIIFGGLYQLNSAFKVWAANYFGDYLGCLLEAGELPSISGTGGDAGVCNQLFKPFTFADGRRIAAVGKTAGGQPSLGSAVAGTERRSGGVGGGGGSNGTPFTAGRAPIKPPAAAEGAKGSQRPINTGNTSVSNYGTPYTGGRIPIKKPKDVLLDTRSLDEQRRVPTGKAPIGVTRSIADQDGAKPPLKVRPPAPKRDQTAAGDTSLTIADFLRYLIIAGIIIALLLFLGGQALQIGKSMD